MELACDLHDLKWKATIVCKMRISFSVSSLCFYPTILPPRDTKTMQKAREIPGRAFLRLQLGDARRKDSTCRGKIRWRVRSLPCWWNVNIMCWLRETSHARCYRRKHCGTWSQALQIQQQLSVVKDHEAFEIFLDFCLRRLNENSIGKDEATQITLLVSIVAP